VNAATTLPARNRAGTFLLAGFVLLALIVAMPVMFAARERAWDAAGQSALLTRDRLGDLLSTMREAESGLRGYMLTGNQNSMVTYRLALAAVPHSLATLDAALADPADQASLAQIHQITGTKLQQLAQAMALFQSGGKAASVALVNTDLNLQTMQNLRSLIGTMQAAQSRRFATIRQQQMISDWFLQGATALAVLGTALLAAFAIRESRRQTDQLREAEARLTLANDALERKVEARTRTLRESESQFRSLAESMPGFVFMTDATGANTYVNPGFCAFTGRGAADLLAYGWAEIIHPDDQGRVLAYWRTCIAHRTPGEVEYRFRRHDGVFRWFLVRAQTLVDETAAVTGWIGTCTDIDARRQAEAALAEYSNTLEQRVAERARELDRIFRLSADILTVTDEAGRFLNISPAWELITGIPVQEAIGKPLLDFVHPDDLETVRAGGARLNSGVPVSGVETRNRRADGGWAWISWRATPRTEDGLAYSVGRDITVERARDEQLRQSQKMELVGQLTGGVAHDFNNLLTIIMGSLELLERSLPNADPKTTRRIAAAMEGARRAAALTHRLLAFSRRQPLAPQTIDANRLLAGMSDMLHRTLGETIAIDIDAAAALWPAVADTNQLENAILNLAVNARDAMPEGGRLTITTRNSFLEGADADGRGDAPPGAYVEIAVTDTGAGMAPEIREKVFEPFFTTKPPGQGTGLGLAQVYGFIKQSGGHATVQSAPGQGTTVKLYLPRQTSGVVAAACPPAPEPASLNGNGETILLVEDEEGVRSFAAEILRDFGYRVLAGENAERALALFEANPEIDLLFTDVVLTGAMNGRALANEILRRRPRTIVLFTTGYTRDAIIHHGRLDEGINFIGKPFAAADLGLTIRRLLEQAPVAALDDRD
jgi:PAS domain S-box-containing protein